MRGQVAEAIEHYVWRMRAQAFGAEAVGYAARVHASVARGFDVHIRVSHHYGFVRRGLQLTQQNLRALWVGLFGCEAIASVHVAEITRKIQAVDDRAAEMDGLVGEHSH